VLVTACLAHLLHTGPAIRLYLLVPELLRSHLPGGSGDGCEGKGFDDYVAPYSSRGSSQFLLTPQLHVHCRPVECVDYVVMERPFYKGWFIRRPGPTGATWRMAARLTQQVGSRACLGGAEALGLHMQCMIQGMWHAQTVQVQSGHVMRLGNGSIPGAVVPP
jgi:hypothetical protein